MSHFSDVVCAILGSKTYITKTVDVAAGATLQFSADTVEIEAVNGPVVNEVIVSLDPVTKVNYIDENGRAAVVLGHARISNSKSQTITIEQLTGGLLTVKYTSCVSDMYPVFKYTASVARRVRYRLGFDNGLSCSVISNLTALGDINGSAHYRADQKIVLENSLPFKLERITNLIISFQRPRERIARQESMAMLSSNSVGSADVEDVIEETSAPVSLGSLVLIPAKGSITVPMPRGVTLKVNTVFADLNLDRLKVINTLELIPIDSTLYPSKGRFITEEGAVKASMMLGFRAVNTPFETELGTNSKISASKADFEEKEYSVEVASTLQRDTIVRISGYRLKGRVDTFKLAAGTTQTFRGAIPPRGY